jgi:cytochrome c
LTVAGCGRIQEQQQVAKGFCPMFRFSVPLVLATALIAGPVLAGGDAAVGEKEFGKCKSCHAITADDGTVIVKGGKVGPNLYGVIGRTAGTAADFKYGDDMVAAGAKGLVWDEAQLSTYIQDPSAFLKTYLGDESAKGKMVFKLAKKTDDVAAYLASVAN